LQIDVLQRLLQYLAEWTTSFRPRLCENPLIS
jgi:hypothetical protein